MLPIAADYPFLEILGTMLAFFGFVIWLRLVFTMFGDVFRRHDISGWAKAGWSLFAIVLPFFGVLVYLATQAQGIAERNEQAVRAAKADFDSYVRETASGGGTAEIARAKELLDSGAISQAEYDVIKEKALR